MAEFSGNIFRRAVMELDALSVILVCQDNFIDILLV